MENHFKNKPVWIAFKQPIIYEGKYRSEAPKNFEGAGVVLQDFGREGVILDDGAFVPMSNVLFIRPAPPVKEGA